jgi:hypothetical protein
MKHRVSLLIVTLVILLANSSSATAQGKRNTLPPGRVAGESGEVRGLFGLSTGTKPISPQVLASPDLVGVSLRGKWPEEQPQENQLTWTFDADIARARQAGKQVILRVSPALPPEWVFRAGARAFLFKDANPHHATKGDTHKMAIPWDPVFLEKWTSFIKQMGRKYANDPAVVLIQMAGANKSGGEMHLPSTKADKENWQNVGYTREKLVHSYKVIINAYDEAFPNKPLALDVSETAFKDGAVQEIAAYASQKLGKRFCIQHNALAAKTNEQANNIHKLVRSFQGNATVGFQLLCSVSGKGSFTEDGKRFGGPLKVAFDLGLRSGASYFEIYTVDLEDPPAARDLHAAALALAR